MRIVDFHSHFFSRTFFDALAEQSPLPGTVDDKLARLAERTGIELPPHDLAEHAARWMAELETHDVEHLVSFASLPAEVPALAQARQLMHGRMTPMAVVDPAAEGAADKVRTLVGEGGFGGILTFPALHHFHIGGEEARGALAALEERRAVCYVHCGLLVVKLRDLLGLPRPYDLAYANPLGVIPAANAYPGVTFVIPHFGAGFLRETLMAGAQCENIFVDTSSTNSWRRTQPGAPSLLEVFARTFEVFGSERVLFGTDSGVFPAGWRKDRYEEQKEIVVHLGLSGTERERFFAGNALGLI